MRTEPGKSPKRLGAMLAVSLLVGSCSAQEEVQASSDGPEILPSATVYQLTFPESKVFTDGFQRFLLEGPQSARLENVELIGGDGYFEIVGVKVAGPERQIGSIQFLPSYPPVARKLGRLESGKNARLAAGSVGSVLLVGMRVTRPGIGSRTGLRVTYSVGDQTYYSDHPAAIVNCPPGTEQSRCDDAYDQAFEDASALVADE